MNPTVIGSRYDQLVHKGLLGSPILTLNQDVLWSIFKINVHLNEKDSLQSLREYSQVCSVWRWLILESPSLWGKLLNLNELLTASDLWRKAVIERSEGSLLWVKGDFIGVSRRKLRPILEFAYEVLETRWDRVQRLYLTIDYRKIDFDKWPSLHRSAPHLQLFKVSITGRRMPIPKTTPQVCLFGHDAPLLVDFQANGLPFALDAPWLCNLRILNVGHTLTSNDILNMLTMTTHVEILRIEHPIAMRKKPDLQRTIHLPNIRQLFFVGHLSTIINVFEHISALDACCVDLSVISVENLSITNLDLTPLQVVGRFIRGFFHKFKTTSISLSHFGSYFFLYDTSLPSSVMIFSLSLRCGGSVGMVNIIDSIFESSPIHPVFSSNIVEVDLDLDLDSSFNTSSTYLYSCSSVLTLYCDERTLECLLQTQKRSSDIVFPFLRSLKLKFIGVCSSDEESAIIQFVRSRLHCSHPITVLDLTECNPYDLEHLESIGDTPSLTIRWLSLGNETMEYRCDDSNVNRLCLSVNEPQ
ncbi:hypothetical protein CVT25_008924 [Psilocybe cyanescens]|uniref:F-box domain-containing protein n=1 Tax=Psilocybe cyanescens TaxID=93625 RepID=A0A409XND0_PSICY|nr:hypothetical protein CVT25_008924 [Psilocybe cyanescens]